MSVEQTTAGEHHRTHVTLKDSNVFIEVSYNIVMSK